MVNLLVQRLQDMIVNTIKSPYGGFPKNSLGYSVSYSKLMEGLLIPIGYQPQKLKQFCGRGNLKQHIPHFVESL